MKVKIVQLFVSKKNYFQKQCSSLKKDKDEIQKNYDALLSKLPLLQKYCHTTEKGRVCDPCPQGWEKHNGQCYYFSTSVTTWNESQNNCTKEAAHLVTVNSEEEQGFITKEGSSSYWIGLTDSAEEGVWRWVDGTDLKQGYEICQRQSQGKLGVKDFAQELTDMHQEPEPAIFQSHTERLSSLGHSRFCGTKEKTRSSSNPCRLISGGLGLLCFLQFAVIIVLSIYLMGVKPKQDNDDCSILAKEKEQLLLKLNNMTQLQEQNNQLQNNYIQLEDLKNKLTSEKEYFQQQCSSLKKEKEEIQKNYDALLSKLPLLQKYCHTTENGRVCDHCPQGWKEHNDQCYYFSTSITTWNESQNNCIKEAAHLVTVNSEEEQDFITKEGSSSYWIGLTGSAEEGVWRWVDGTDLKHKGFWLYGEPDNKDQQSAGKTANCVITSREWRDEPCEDQYRWICETQTLHPKPLHI